MGTILKNVRAVCIDEIKNCDLKIENGIISEIKSGIDSLPCDEVIECNGAILMPGFIDTHMHGAKGQHAEQLESSDLGIMTEFLATQGVTAVAAATATSPFDTTIELIKNIKHYAENSRGTRILGIHAEGPFLSPKRQGGMSNAMQAPSTEKLDAMIEAAGGLLKIITVAPEIDGALNFIKYATKKGIKVSMGHTDATYEEAMAGIEAGACQMTHTFNAARPINHREPGVLGAALTDNRVKCEMICDFVHLHPTTLKLIYRAKGADNINMISDSISASGMYPYEGEYDVEGSPGTKVINGVIILPSGTISGSVKTLFDGVKNMASLGIPLVDIARMASYNPAVTLGIEDKVGSIETGKYADLVLLDESMEILSVYIGGERFK